MHRHTSILIGSNYIGKSVENELVNLTGFQFTLLMFEQALAL